MFYITNKRDVELAYIVMRELSEYGSKYKDTIDEYKRRIRKYFKKENENNSRIVKDEGIDGYIELVTLPECIETENEAEEYFDEELRIECMPSGYDCTGQAFTCWHRAYKRRGRWIIYHCVAFDV